MKQPAANEYSDVYTAYVAHVGDRDVLNFLNDQLKEFTALLGDLSPEQVEFRYAAGKWSVKGVLSHIVDAERILSYRILCIARGDTSPLPGMDQDAYAAGSDLVGRSFESLLGEFRHLREANILLFESFDEEVSQRRGTAGGNPFTVRALIYVVAGHVQHHIEQLRLRYLAS